MNTVNKVENNISDKEKTWGMIVHLSALLQFIIHSFGAIIGPLVVWLIKKDTMPFVNDQGREALNFNISIAIYGAIAGTGIIPVSFLTDDIDLKGVIYIVLLALLYIAIFLFWLINVIRAAITANKGVCFRYPLAIRFFKTNQS